jgi:hypothetical protein
MDNMLIWITVHSPYLRMLLQAGLIAGSTASVYLVDRGLRLMRIPVGGHALHVACIGNHMMLSAPRLILLSELNTLASRWEVASSSESLTIPSACLLLWQGAGLVTQFAAVAMAGILGWRLIKHSGMRLVRLLKRNEDARARLIQEWQVGPGGETTPLLCGGCPKHVVR